MEKSENLPSFYNQMGKYDLQIDVSITNGYVEDPFDFIYIVPERTPFSSNFSSVNSRAKMIKFPNDHSTGSAMYSIQYLAMNEIYKLLYLRKRENNQVELLFTSQKFKFILRTKTSIQLSLLDSASNNESASKYHLEVALVFEGDPDFYRENFNFEMGVLSQGSYSKPAGAFGLDSFPQARIISNTTEDTSRENKSGAKHLEEEISEKYQRNRTPLYSKDFELQINAEYTPQNIPLSCSSLQGSSVIQTYNTNQRSMKGDDTFIIDESKNNDYAANMTAIISLNNLQNEQKHRQIKRQQEEQTIKEQQQAREKSKGRTFSQAATQKSLMQQKQILSSAPSDKQNRLLLFDSPFDGNSNSHIKLSNLDKSALFQSTQKVLYKNFKSDKENSEIETQHYTQQTPTSAKQTPSLFLNISQTPLKLSQKNTSSPINCQKKVNINSQTPNSNHSKTTKNNYYFTSTKPPIKSQKQGNSLIQSVSTNVKQPIHNVTINSYNSKLIKVKPLISQYSSPNYLNKIKSESSSIRSQKITSSNINNNNFSSTPRIHLRFENEIQKMMIEQKINESLATATSSTQQNTPQTQGNLQLYLPTQDLISSPSPLFMSVESVGTNSVMQDIGTPAIKKLPTVEEANSPFETSVNRFNTQKSSPSKHRGTHIEQNKINETEELAYSLPSNELKRVRNCLKQFNKDLLTEGSQNSSRGYDSYSISAFFPDYKQQQNNQCAQQEKREKTIQYMIPVYEYKMEKLGFEFTYIPNEKKVTIKPQNRSENKRQELQQSSFIIDERIKTDQLTYFFEDICANVAYQAMD